LATDLDGTFLGGSKEAREKLYRAIEKQKEAITLIFVTGRDLDFIREIVEKTRCQDPIILLAILAQQLLMEKFFPFCTHRTRDRGKMAKCHRSSPTNSGSCHWPVAATYQFSLSHLLLL